MIPQPPDLGPFRLLYPTARGATAQVWAGIHRESQHPVAIKFLTGIRPDAADARRLFVREVRAVAALDHGAIIRVHDYGDVPAAVAEAAEGRLPAGTPYLVMDWCGGGTLEARQGRARFAEVRALLLTVLDGLAHAHARGVVHRDLKPANVLLGDAGPVLSDFGLVFEIEAPAKPEMHASGTPNYMAPEQVFADWRAFGPWTDLYAVGCLGWALIAGQAPFAGAGPRAAMLGNATGTLPTLRPRMNVPAAIEPWLRRLLEKKPSRRFQFAADAAVALMAMPDQVDEDAALPSPGKSPEPLGESQATVMAPPVFIALAETAWSGGLGPDARPPMPATWRRPDAPWAAHLPGCGRALAELREVRLRGRVAERDHLWDQLRAVIDGKGREGNDSDQRGREIGPQSPAPPQTATQSY
ncbi:MAG: serine/threonine protein kinase, partial [Myxococcales bacterium]|nr:serine/threonine protein kinase [Myxococcales bacterium]